MTTILLPLALLLWTQDAGPPVPEPERYLRIVEDGTDLRLEVAARALRREGGEETLWLVGAAHVAAPGFFDELQAFLDGADVVLFEGVRPADWEPEEPGPEWRRRATYTRMRALARRLTAHRAAAGDWPAALAALEAPDHLPVGRTLVDGWGTELRWAPREEGAAGPVEVTSAGPDGAHGTDDDLRLSDEPALVPADSGHGDGLQSRMARALDLVFQLDAVDDGGPRWRNCDMSVDELGQRLEEAGVDPDDLLGLLDGSSVVAQIAGRLLDWIGATETGSGILRLVGIEMLGRADELLEAAPGDLAAMMDVILSERNEVVVAAVRAEAEAGGARSIAVFYGAAHLRPLEASLAAELGYAPVETRWLTAIRLDTDELGLPATQVRMIRGMIARQLALQLRIAQAQRRATEGAEGEPPGGD